MSHREKFEQAMMDCAAGRGEEPNHEYGAMLYVLTSLGYPWEQIRPKIDWRRVSLPIEEFSRESGPHFSPHEHTMVEIAWGLFNPAYGKVAFGEFLSLDDSLFHKALTGVQYLRTGKLPADAWAEHAVR